jgi:hypothetical protein
MDKIKAIISGDADFQNSSAALLGMGNIKGAEGLLDYWKAAVQGEDPHRRRDRFIPPVLPGIFNSAAAPVHTSR